jgi:dihydrofolate reductase
VRKHVVPNTLKTTDWKNSQLIGPDVTTAVRKIKEMPGRDIGLHGSISLVQSLLHERLVDELVLYVMPTVAGQGLRRLFDGTGNAHPMKLVRSCVAPNGIAILTYAPA